MTPSRVNSHQVGSPDSGYLPRSSKPTRRYQSIVRTTSVHFSIAVTCDGAVSTRGIIARLPGQLTYPRGVAKIRYQIDLNRRFFGPPVTDDRVRAVTPEDAPQLASLMLDAYMDTIDYEGEDLDDAVAEVGSYLTEGTPLLDFSRVVVHDGVIVSGILLSETEERPFVNYVMTRASHKGQGVGALVTRHALAALAEAGHHSVLFYITEGNEPSERLFRSLGAKATG